LFNLHQVSEIRLISPLVYNLGLSHLVHTLIMEGTHSPGLCHITLTFFCSSTAWSTDDFLIQPGLTIFGPHTDLGSTCGQVKCYLTLTSFSVYCIC